jgi:predicted PurR-regulated permease PerM
MTREHLFAAFFFAVFFYLLYQTFRIFAPFLQPMIWGSVLALTFFPLSARLTRVLGNRETLTAVLLTAALVVVVTVPTVLFGSVLTKQAAGLYTRVTAVVERGGSEAVVGWIAASPMGGLWERVEPYVDQYDLDLPGMAGSALNTASTILVGRATGAARNLVRVAFEILIVVVTFFVLIRDGPRIVSQVRSIVPMERANIDAIISTLYDTISAVVQAMLATAIAQGVLAGFGYWLSGLPFSLFLGVLSGFLSLIPYAVPLVWVSCAVYLAVTGSVGGAIFLSCWGVVVIGSVDNIIRPLVIGGRAKLSPFLLFFAILGGLAAYGFLGLLLGPVIVATVFAFLRIYRAEYGQEAALAPTEPAAKT